MPERPLVDPPHPLGCHRPRVADRLVFEKMLLFGCAYGSIADSSCSASTIRNRRDEWIKLKMFERLKMIALELYDRIVGLILEEIAVGGCITKAPGGGEIAGRSPVDRGKRGTLGPLPDKVTVRLEAGYDSKVSRDLLEARELRSEIARKGDKAPILAGQRWHVERTNV